MNFWTGLILGIIIGWLVEWIIDWLFWRRDAAEAQEAELLLAERQAGIGLRQGHAHDGRHGDVRLACGKDA